MNEQELRTLERLSWKVFGCAYTDLDPEDQDMLYCMWQEGEIE